jgi:G:T/U-mismatch repair DNA glycosylase
MEWHWKESETTIAESWAAIFEREAAQATNQAARAAAQDRAASARAHAQQSQANDLAAQLERGAQSAQRLQEHRTGRAAADDLRREHDQATGQQRSTEHAVAKDAPEAGR